MLLLISFFFISYVYGIWGKRPWTKTLQSGNLMRYLAVKCNFLTKLEKCFSWSSINLRPDFFLGPSSFASLPPSYQSIINDSNDSLEEYMEIQKPENTHLEHLVKNMDSTVTDPNQCLICKRILSCKSALMVRIQIFLTHATVK